MPLQPNLPTTRALTILLATAQRSRHQPDRHGACVWLKRSAPGATVVRPPQRLDRVHESRRDIRSRDDRRTIFRRKGHGAAYCVRCSAYARIFSTSCWFIPTATMSRSSINTARLQALAAMKHEGLDPRIRDVTQDRRRWQTRRRCLRRRDDDIERRRPAGIGRYRTRARTWLRRADQKGTGQRRNGARANRRRASLEFVARTPGVSSVIVGTTDVMHLRENVAIIEDSSNEPRRKHSGANQVLRIFCRLPMIAEVDRFGTCSRTLTSPP